MTAMPEFERARLDVLAYFLHDDRDVDGGAKAIDDLSFPRLVAIVDAVIRGLVTDPSVAYALAWADAGGTVPDLGATASREAIPAADAEREFRIDAGLFTGPLMVSVSITDLTEVLGLARHNAALLATGHPSKEAFVRVDMAHTDAITPRAEWASGIAYTGELAITAINEAALALAETVPAGADPGKVGRLIGDLYAAAQGIRHTTAASTSKPMPDPDVIPVRRSDLVELLVVHHDHERPATLGAIDRLMNAAGVEGTVGDFLDETAQHATPEVRADDAIDPVTVVTEAARWVRARLSSSAGIYDQGTYDANSGIKAAENLDRLAALITASRPATVDDVHRLAEAGGALAKAVDRLLAGGTVIEAAKPDYLARLQTARDSWGHAARGLYAVPHPRFVEKARGVAIAAGELGAFVDGQTEIGRFANDPEDSGLAVRLVHLLGVAIEHFDEVDTAYRADREAHARRIRLSD